MFYSDLTQDQIYNLSHLLDYAQLKQLNDLQGKYTDIVKKRDLILYRNNVLQTIMLNQIEIENLLDWFNTLKQNNNNTIVHAEYASINEKKRSYTKNIVKKFQQLEKSIIDISRLTITEPVITSVGLNSNEIELTLLVPARILKEEDKNFPVQNQRTVFIQEHAFYFIYIWINNDNEEKNITFSLPSTTNYHSVWGVTSKKNIADLLTKKSLEFLENILGDIKLVPPKWVNSALRKITSEYYYHNNKEIEEELKKIEERKKLLEKSSTLINITDYFSTISPILNNDVSLKRIEKAIDKIIEKELIAKFGLNNCHHPFEVFLQEVNKGETTFKSRNGVSNNEKKGLPSIDTRDTIISILDSSSLKVIGLKYYSKDDQTVPYKFICKENWFILEQTNDTGTQKELVKNVLTEFKNYKGCESITNKAAE